MLEDFTMEKKPSNRSVQTPGKGCVTEPKKTQDVANSKQFPRSRRKEQSGCSNNVKFDQGRKPNPQKNKSLDKRPRPRGQYNYGGKEDTQVGYLYESDLEPVTISGSRKQNLNHLLNFHYEPRGENVARPFCQRSSYQYGSRLRLSTHKHKYNKEHFLQANCQFVVRADGDYSPYMADPDTLVGWDFVEQIRVASVESGTCPICLSTPVAGKMTRCGHVYCYPCILHYLALSDKTWRKCPICYEAVHKNDLKSVMVLNRIAYTLGQMITFQLMKRERCSLIASPVSQFDLRQSYTSPLLSVSENQLDTAYSKLLAANNQEILQIIEKEKYELEQQLVEEQGCPEQCFIEQALELVSQRKQDLLQKTEKCQTYDSSDHSSEISHPVKESSEPVNAEKVVYQSAFDDIINTSDDGNGTKCEDSELLEGRHQGNIQENYLSSSETLTDLSRPRYESVSSDGDDSHLITTITAEDLEINTHPQTPAKHFFFYQAIDGQQIYLHAVNVRMLELNYGSLEQSPHTVTGVIVEKEAGSMTEDLRKRLRYLQHLPLTCQFEVAEIQLVPPVVSQETLDTFKEQLELRRRRRQKRAKDERRREKKIQEVEFKMFGRHPSPRLRIESFHHFPHCGIMTPEEFPRPMSPESSRASSPSSVSHSSESPLTSTLSALVLDSVTTPAGDASGPSFAEMLREGKTNKLDKSWPTVCEKNGVSVKNTLPRSSPLPHSSIDSDAEAPAPRFRQSFSDAIAIALEQASVYKDDVEPSNGRKKKKKQKILFSTGMTCISK